MDSRVVPHYESIRLSHKTRIQHRPHSNAWLNNQSFHQQRADVWALSFILDCGKYRVCCIFAWHSMYCGIELKRRRRRKRKIRSSEIGERKTSQITKNILSYGRGTWLRGFMISIVFIVLVSTLDVLFCLSSTNLWTVTWDWESPNGLHICIYAHRAAGAVTHQLNANMYHIQNYRHAHKYLYVFLNITITWNQISNQQTAHTIATITTTMIHSKAVQFNFISLLAVVVLVSFV